MSAKKRARKRFRRAQRVLRAIRKRWKRIRQDFNRWWRNRQDARKTSRRARRRLRDARQELRTLGERIAGDNDGPSKHQQERLEKLNAEIERLEAKLNRLDRRLDRLSENIRTARPRFRRLRRRLRWAIARRTRRRRAYKRLLAKSKAGAGDFETWMLNGRPGNVSTAVKGSIVRAVRAGLYVTSTTGGAHAPGSWHHSGNAVDVAGGWSAMVAHQGREANRGHSRYRELFGPAPWYLKNGSRYGGAFPDHGDHVHAAPTS